MNASNDFNFFIFGFTSNLAQLKIIPALYDLEEKGSLSDNTKVIGIGRKNININDYVTEVLTQENRHHIHAINENIKQKLIKRITYLMEDFDNDNDSLYQKIKEFSGNNIYYLATYPDLYHKIFQSLKSNNLNISNTGWVRIMIEKPVSLMVNNLVEEYFDESQIYRVDHYLGKQSLRNVFGNSVDISNLSRVDVVIDENFGIGKRGLYYDSIGALIDMGQNHLLQMVASVFSVSPKSIDREEVIDNLQIDKGNIIFGQYDGYLNEDNIKKDSITDTFFVLKTSYKNIPIYLSSGKKLSKNEAKIIVHYKNTESIEFTISPLTTPDIYDPYERLILDCNDGNQTYFNSKKEIDLSWRFINGYNVNRSELVIYKISSDLFDTMSAKLSS